MVGGGTDEDPLSRWLSGEVRAALDVLTGKAMDVVGILDRDLTVRYINWTTGNWTRDAVIGRNVLELSPPSDREFLFDSYSRVLQTGVSTRLETMFRRDSGVATWDVRIGPIHFEGEIIGLIVMAAAWRQPLLVFVIVPLGLVWFVSLFGFIVNGPNQSRVVQLFGTYVGTVREVGFFYGNPFYWRTRVSLRVRTFETGVQRTEEKKDAGASGGGGVKKEPESAEKS